MDTDDNWRTEAACRGMDPALFYSERGESTSEAKAVCAGCSVRSACAEEALGNAERFGVWGGLSERQRRTMRRASAGLVGRRKVGESERALIVALRGAGQPATALARQFGVHVNTVRAVVRDEAGRSGRGREVA